MEQNKALSAQELATLLSWGEAKKKQEPFSDEERALFNSIAFATQAPSLSPDDLAQMFVRQKAMYEAPADVYIKNLKGSHII